VDLIAGLPHETLAGFRDSFDRAYLLGAHTLQLGFLKLLHGSELRKQSQSLGIRYSTQPPYEIQSSPWLSAEDILELKQTENALQHTYNKARFLSTLKYVLSVSGLRPYVLLNSLGAAAPNNGTQLADYAGQIYGHFISLPGVDKNELCDNMVCDWLSMVKGTNMPAFLRNPDKRRKLVVEKARRLLEREPHRNETALLRCGKGVFVDNTDPDPVTGLYRIHFTEIE